MNNKGFIATSLIYSFFLIFITLFLTIIADYLQNKVLLNTIENGIKDNINNTKSIEDFDIGDILTIDVDGGIGELPKDSKWIIANKNFDYDKSDGNDNSNIILYNIIPSTYTDFSTDGCITENIIKTDLQNSNNLNGTRINELLYNTTDSFDIKFNSSGNNIKKVSESCAVITDTEISHETCETSSLTGNCRIRKVYEIGSTKLLVNPDEIGGFTITGVTS